MKQTIDRLSILEYHHRYIIMMIRDQSLIEHKTHHAVDL